MFPPHAQVLANTRILLPGQSVDVTPTPRIKVTTLRLSRNKNPDSWWRWLSGLAHSHALSGSGRHRLGGAQFCQAKMGAGRWFRALTADPNFAPLGEVLERLRRRRTDPYEGR